MWNNGERNIKLGKIEFNMTLLSRGSSFNVKTHTDKNPTGKDLEIPDIQLFSVDERILRLKEFARLARVFCVKPNPPQWEGSTDSSGQKE